MRNNQTFVAAITQALDGLLSRHPEAILLGEDVEDPYGGAFRASQGLSTRHGGRVRNTPISEASLVGIGAGLALAGKRPIIEIMFSDFLGLCADQIINHATKFPWMYGRDIPVPLMIRTATGSGKQYGPTHSQSLETMFLGVPNLEIWSPFPLHNVDEIYRQAFASPLPAIVAESKALYPLRLNESIHLLERRPENGETLLFSNAGRTKPDLVLLAHGRMAHLALQALDALSEAEIFAQLFVPARLQPFDPAPLAEGVATSGRLLVIDESWRAQGFGTHVAHMIHQRWFARLKKPVCVMGAADLPIGTAPAIEAQALPGQDDLLSQVRELMR